MDAVMGDTATWGLILGIVTPLLVSLVQQPAWSKRLRAVVSAAASVVIGAVTVLASGDAASAPTWFATLGLVLVASNTAYATLWKPTGLAPAIEMRSTPASRRPAANTGPPG